MLSRDDGQLQESDMDVWVLADRLSAEVNGEPPSERQWLVQRVAWAIHVSAASKSPRKDWAEMDDEARARVYAQARGAIDAYEVHQRREPSA